MQKILLRNIFFISDDNGSVIIKFLHITVYVGNEEIKFSVPIVLF